MMPNWRSVPLPQPFFSEETGAPFRHCLACDRSLLEAGTEYLIEKAFRTVRSLGSRDLIFEYALCLPCYDAVWTSFSEESRQRIEAYFSERIDYEGRARRLLHDKAADPRRWLSHCVVTGTAAEDLDEYQVVGLCEGDRMLLAHVPCLLGGAAMDELAALLSTQTLDEMGGFMQDFFPSPPGLEKDVPPLIFV